jgi:hypothetical protein
LGEGDAPESVPVTEVCQSEFETIAITGEEAQSIAPTSAEPAMLGWLALGAPGLAVWRKPEQEQAN